MRNNIIDTIKQKAKNAHRHIVLPEGNDPRVFEAAKELRAQNLVSLTVLADESFREQYESIGVSFKNPQTDELREEFTDVLYALRKHKNLSREQAASLVSDPLYFGTLLVHTDRADGLVAGSLSTTADTLRPALQIIKTVDGVPKASSFFLMIHEGEVIFFADCAFIPHPNAQELASIALLTAKNASSFLDDVRVALLSFSTKGSAQDPSLEVIRQALALIKEQNPSLCVDGELQLDAAIVPEVASKKCPDSPVQGKANVLVFPDLASGNIGYKIAQRFAHDKPIGPIIQGLKKPINDLSRGCTVEDIVLTVCFTALEGDLL